MATLNPIKTFRMKRRIIFAPESLGNEGSRKTKTPLTHNYIDAPATQYS